MLLIALLLAPQPAEPAEHATPVTPEPPAELRRGVAGVGLVLDAGLGVDEVVTPTVAYAIIPMDKVHHRFEQVLSLGVAL